MVSILLFWYTSLIHYFFFCRPLFERISINLNNPHHHPASSSPKKLTITAIGARSKPYIKSLTINGISITQPIIKHEQIANGAEVVFEMSDKVEKWGNDEGVLKAFGVGVGVGSSSKVDSDGGYFHIELWKISISFEFFFFEWLDSEMYLQELVIVPLI